MCEVGGSGRNEFALDDGWSSVSSMAPNDRDESDLRARLWAGGESGGAQLGGSAGKTVTLAITE